MSDFINSINSASGVVADPTALSSDPSKTVNKEAFLKLFVAQMQNQDPINPQESSEMAAQLAQYSQVEQLTNLNSGMNKLLAANQNATKLSALKALGQQVIYKSSTVSLEKEPVEIGYKLDRPASEVTVTLSKKGTVVASFDGEELGLDTGNHYITWDGKNENGTKASPGEYTIKVHAKDSSGKAFTPTSFVRDEVTGVDLSGENGAILQTTTGRINFNAIMEIIDKSHKTTNTTTGNEDSSNTSTT